MKLVETKKVKYGFDIFESDNTTDSILCISQQDDGTFNLDLGLGETGASPQDIAKTLRTLAAHVTKIAAKMENIK